jgi:hypothetical protein
VPSVQVSVNPKSWHPTPETLLSMNQNGLVCQNTFAFYMEAANQDSKFKGTLEDDDILISYTKGAQPY